MTSIESRPALNVSELSRLPTPVPLPAWMVKTFTTERTTLIVVTNTGVTIVPNRTVALEERTKVVVLSVVAVRTEL